MVELFSGMKVLCSCGSKGSKVSPRTASNFRGLLELDHQAIGQQF